MQEKLWGMLRSHVKIQCMLGFLRISRFANGSVVISNPIVLVPAISGKR